MKWIDLRSDTVTQPTQAMRDAMYNAIVHHRDQARAVIDGVKAFGGDLPVMLLPGGVAVEAARRAGLTVIAEAFADRAYLPDGRLVPRTEQGAVFHEVDRVVERVVLRVVVDVRRLVL